MGIRFACHVCNQPLNIKRELAGRRGICPACSSRIRIPTSDAEKSTPVEGASNSSAAIANPYPDPAAEPVSILDDGATEATWYVRPPSGGQYGPASGELLKQWIDEGRVSATALLWRDGWPQWRSAAEALPEWVARLPTGSGVSEPADSGETSQPPRDLDSAPDEPAAAPIGEIRSGQAPLRRQRRKRSTRRLRWVGSLAIVAVVLIGILIFILTSGSPAD